MGKMGRKWNMISFPVMLSLAQLAILILFGLFVDYGWDGTPVSLRGQFLPASRGDPNYRGPGASAAELSQPRITIEDSYSSEFRSLPFNISCIFPFNDVSLS